MRTLKTDAGCTVVWPVGLTIQQPVQWTGRCENGLAAGVGLLSYQFDTGSLGIARWHIKAMFVNGKQIGVNWVVADPIVRQSNDSSFSMSLSIRRDGERLSRKTLQPSNSLDQALQTADAMVSEAQSLGLPTMTADVLKNDIRQWYQNPNEYTGGGMSPSSMTKHSADDPKVFGSSAVNPEEARRKAEELRLANEQREENLRQRQEAQARAEREKEQRELRELKELTESLQQLSNTLNSSRNINQKPQPSINQQVPSTAQPAHTCLTVIRKSTGGADLKNNCGYAVEAGWCVVGYDCKNGNWGYSNQWTIGPGHAYPVSGSIDRIINFAACTPTQTSINSISPNEYRCGK